MFEEVLPDGWVSTRLGNYMFLKNGFAFKSTDYVDKSEDTFPIIRISNIDGKLASDKSAAHIKSANIANGFEVENGDLLIAMSGATTGKVGVYQGLMPAYQNQRVGNLKLIVDELGSKGFRNYLVAFLSPDILKIAYGGAQPNISGSAIENMVVNLPPLAEQHQIAAKLDELLAQVDGIKTRLDAIPKILKRFRQSVLAAAVTGNLTQEWRKVNPGIKYSANSVELTEFRGKELGMLPKNWQWLKFDQVASVASNLQDPLLTPEAFHIAPNHIESGTGKLLEYTTVSEDKVTSSKHRFYDGQILYSKIRPYLCKAAIVSFSGLCSADMYPINSKINTQYLFRWILSHQFTYWASNAESRSVLPKINQKDLGIIPVPTPPLQEQTEIVRRVEQLFAYADQIEQRVKDAQARVNHLTQSILAKAFRGELTADWRAQNPDLISGENSVEALLSKIKAERINGKRKK
ncbi:restriction endonuclease subunit S [Methylomonas albis]|uniref:Restriction endonuclease subunit S n=1 Tax=Methylomonas albis TaxID=1854563 RepID=A0ABR9D6M0_9GAMM|nr:restriction endonuclease subunit S [Methylomonas albis]MBD9358769.1 restriction endonuclease subunit S [Methylomonas albis]